MIKWIPHIVLFAFMMSACHQEKPAISQEILYPDIEVHILNKTIRAGEQLKLEIKQLNQLPINCQLHLSNGLISQLIPVQKKASQNLILEKKHTQVSGYYKLKVLAGSKVLHIDSLMIVNANEIEHLDIYNGPRSISVDQTQQSMTVAVPKDSLGNPVLDGSDIDFIVYQTNGKTIEEKKKTQHQLSYKINQANQKAQDIFIGVSQNETASNKQKTISTPAWPFNTKIKAQNYVAYANNRDFVKITTELLKDQFGNTISDGTLIHFHILSKGQKVGIYNGITIDGQAFSYIKNPSEASSWTIRASIGDHIISQDLLLQFKSDLKSIPSRFDKGYLTIGPLIGQLGQFISDGSKVKLLLNNKEIVIETFDGMAQFELDELNWLKNQEGIISVSGKEKRIVRND